MIEHKVGFAVTLSADVRVVARNMEEAIQKAVREAESRWPDAEIILDDVVVLGPAARGGAS